MKKTTTDNKSDKVSLDKLKNEILGAGMRATKSFTFTDSLDSHVDEVIKTARDSKPIHDAYGNTLTATGIDDKVKSFSTYGFNNNTLNWPLWLALYNDSWVFRKAIDKPSQDMVNCGFTLHGDEDYTNIYKAYDRYKFDLIQLLQWGALFGGSIAVMMFDGITDEEMTKPINPEKIKGKRMRLYVTDRWYGCSPSNENVTAMKDIDFGTPVSYGVSFADGKMLSNIHHSYVLRYEHRTAPKLIKCGQLQGWGYAEGSHILNELSRDDQLKSAITSLVNKSLIEVIKMAGMRGVFMGADKGNEEQLTKRLEMVNWGRNFNSLTFLDKDDDYIQHELSNISGLSNLLETNMWLVAAAVDMPGILFGELKGGLSQDTDSTRRYAITIENRNNSYFRPVLYKLLMVLFKVYGLEGKPDFDFNSLIADELNAGKMQAISDYSGTLQRLIEQGVISKYQAAKSIQGFINNKTISIDFTEEQLNKLKYEEEMEILAAYKSAGKALPEDILASQFPSASHEFNHQNPANDLPDKISYLENIAEESEVPREAEENQSKKVEPSEQPSEGE